MLNDENIDLPRIRKLFHADDTDEMKELLIRIYFRCPASVRQTRYHVKAYEFNFYFPRGRVTEDPHFAKGFGIELFLELLRHAYPSDGFDSYNDPRDIVQRLNNAKR